jgi:hypothetical protein
MGLTFNTTRLFKLVLGAVGVAPSIFAQEEPAVMEKDISVFLETAKKHFQVPAKILTFARNGLLMP